jgi:murein DD-endopeptidase MepM/ murein hydrolase activator NlpD
VDAGDEVVQRVRRSIAMVAVLALLPGVAAAQDMQLDGALDALGSEREAVSEQLDVARDREQDARARLAAVDAELDDAEASLATLEAELAAASAALDDARDREAAAREELLTVTAELDEVEVELARSRELLGDRIVASFKHGQIGYAEVFFVAGDISDIIATGAYLGRVLEGDRQLVADVEQLVAGVESQRAAAQALRREAERQAGLAASAAMDVEQAVAEQERLTELVRVRREEREQMFVALRDDRTAIEGHLAGLEAESQRIEAQLAEIARQQAAEAERQAAELQRQAEEEQRRYEEEQRRYEAEQREAELQRQREQEQREREAADTCEAQGAGGECGSAPDAPAPPPPPPPPPSAGVGGGGQPVVGGWTRPAPGPVTSGFGPRWGRMHRGVDIGVGVGTAVVAARPGTVVHVTNGCHPTSSPGCGGGFGNYVTVVHDAGFATVYAHLASVAVGVGQPVGAGQAVGGSGNSGNSTGPHLHFEIRIAGDAVNPCGYIAC